MIVFFEGLVFFALSFDVGLSRFFWFSFFFLVFLTCPKRTCFQLLGFLKLLGHCKFGF